MKKTLTLLPMLVCGGLVLAGCASKTNDDGGASGDGGVATNDDNDGTADEGGSAETNPNTTAPTGSAGTSGAESEATSNGTSETGAGPEAGDSETAGFVLEPDGSAMECDLWADADCPEGQKCMPWANDGGSSWNASKCAPLDANPQRPGDDCTVDGTGVSGVDNCDNRTMCWNVDAMGVGICTSFCTGSQEEPSCADPDTSCVVANEGVLILCLPGCDPLLQECETGQACYPIILQETYACAPDASGPDQGALGDPCEYLNACDPGLYCENANMVPDCTGSMGCCAQFCDTAEPVCMAQGTECAPLLEAAPPGRENVGGCTLPM